MCAIVISKGKYTKVNKIKNKIAKIVATVFYLGYFPIASGTIGTLIGMGIYYLIKNDIRLYSAVAIIVFVLGFVCSHIYAKEVQQKDPHEIIIDEVSSVFIVYLLIPFSINIFVIGFFIYRALDVIKPPPIRNIEKASGGLGIMADDILAAVYTNIILRVLLLLKI